MTSPSVVEVKVVFDAASRGRRGAVRVAPHTRAEGARAWHALGVVHLLVAAALYYGIWWRVDPFLYMTLMMKTPVDMDLGAAAGMFGVPGAADEARAEKARVSASTRMTQTVLGSTVGGWLALSTASACALALAAGAGWARFRGSGLRRAAWFIAVLAALVVVVSAYVEWQKYERAYPPNHLRCWMGGVVLLFGAIGLLLGRLARGLSTLAGITLIIAGVGTVAAMLLGARHDAIEPQYATAAALAIAFGVHSAYGWLTLMLVRWVR